MSVLCAEFNGNLVIDKKESNSKQYMKLQTERHSVIVQPKKDASHEKEILVTFGQARSGRNTRNTRSRTVRTSNNSITPWGGPGEEEQLVFNHQYYDLSVKIIDLLL